MAYPIREIEGRRTRRVGLIALIVAALFLLTSLRWLSSFAIDYQWWQEMGQLQTYFSMLAYAVVPVAIATVIAFIAFWIAHARALKFAGTGLGRHRWYRRLSTLALFLLGLLRRPGYYRHLDRRSLFRRTRRRRSRCRLARSGLR